MFDENVSFYYVSDEKVDRSVILRFCKKEIFPNINNTFYQR